MKRSAPILVVEDDAACRDLVRQMLLDAGFDVVEARDGREALGVLVSDQTEPGLVILDLDMPVMSGRQLLAVIGNYRRLAKIPVLITSAERDAWQPIGHPAVVGVIPKPIDLTGLLAIVEEHIVRSPAARTP
jgi:DNA-binding response OmpR family regulator